LFNLNIERAILSNAFKENLLSNDEDQAELFSYDADIFYHIPHKTFFEITKELYNNSIDINTINIFLEINKHHSKNFASDLENITLAIFTQTPISPKKYKDILIEYKNKRAMSKAIINAEEAIKINDDYVTIKSTLLSSIDDITTDNKSNTTNLNFNIIFDKAEEVFTTGFNNLDAKIKGFQKGQLIVLGGLAGAGKSTLAINLAVNYAKRSKVANIISYEMTNQAITKIALQNYHKKNEYQLTKDFLNEEKTPIQKFITLTSNLSSDINNIKEHIKSQTADLIIIDHLQLLSVKDAKDIYTKTSILTRELKLSAMTTNKTILLISQLNRNYAIRSNKIPQLSDLRNSSSIEADADIVMFLHSDPKLSTQAVEPKQLIIAKNRAGSIGTLKFDFNKHLMSFEELFFNYE
jgi:replicative DNA helicase